MKWIKKFEAKRGKIEQTPEEILDEYKEKYGF